jgi:hypothetical protein
MGMAPKDTLELFQGMNIETWRTAVCQSLLGYSIHNIHAAIAKYQDYHKTVLSNFFGGVCGDGLGKAARHVLGSTTGTSSQPWRDWHLMRKLLRDRLS